MKEQDNIRDFNKQNPDLTAEELIEKFNVEYLNLLKKTLDKGDYNAYIIGCGNTNHV